MQEIKDINSKEINRNNIILLEEAIDLTFNFSNKIKSKLLYIIKERIRDGRYSSFDKLYRGSMELAETFSVPYQERFSERLDAPISPVDNRLLYEKMSLNEEQESSQDSSFKQGLASEDYIEILRKELNSSEFDIFKYLVSNSKNGLNLKLSKDGFLISIPQIRNKIERLEERIYNGRIIIPKKIVSIDFDSEELFKYKYTITDRQISLMLEAHKKGMSQYKAARYARVSSHRLVDYYWKKFGLKAHNKHSEKLSDEKIALIKEAHSKRMSQYKAARYADVSQTTVSKHWKNLGLKPHNSKNGPIPDNKVALIKEGHDIGLNQAGTAKYAGVSVSTVYTRREELELKNHDTSDHNVGGHISISDEKLSLLKDAHTKKMTQMKAALYADVSLCTVKNYWKKLGLKSNRRGGKGNVIPNETLELILDAHGKKMSQPKAALYADVSHVTVKKYWTKFGLEI